MENLTISTERLIKAIKYLLKREGISVRELARRSQGITDRKIGQLLNLEQDVTLSKLDAIAFGFKLDAVDLIWTDTPEELETMDEIKKLIKAFNATDDEGRSYILTTAEREARRLTVDELPSKKLGEFKSPALPTKRENSSD